MYRTYFEKTATKLHFGLLLLIILNAFAASYIGYGFRNMVVTAFKVLVYFSAVVLFFHYIKPYKRKVLYFGMYIVFPIVSLICWICDSILGILLLGFLFFMLPEPIIFNGNGIVIYKSYKGLMHSCCSYEVTETRLLLFQKSYRQITLEETFEFKVAQIKNDTLVIEDGYHSLHKIPLIPIY